MAKVALTKLTTVPSHGKADLDESQRRPDYAARLRNAFQNAAGQALVSREDAIGAAAEIEQLWAAFRIMVGRTNGNIPLYCRGQCCNWLSERLHAEN